MARKWPTGQCNVPTCSKGFHVEVPFSDCKLLEPLKRDQDQRDIEGNPVLLGRVKGSFKPSYRCGLSHQKYTDKNNVDQLCKNMTDDDRALLVLYSSKQESLKASTTSAHNHVSDWKLVCCLLTRQLAAKTRRFRRSDRIYVHVG